jgi:hypothetical protein
MMKKSTTFTTIFPVKKVPLSLRYAKKYFLVVSQLKLRNYGLQKWWMRRERIIDVFVV